MTARDHGYGCGHNQRNGRDERGSVSVWLLTSTFVMTMLVGLAVDLGGQVHAQQRAHDLAAQAARTAGQRLQAGPAIEGDRVSVDTGAARSAARDYLRAAGVAGVVTTAGGDVITVRVADAYHTRFLGLIGINRLTVTGDASARLIRSLGDTEQ